MLHPDPFPETPSTSGALDADGKRQGSGKSVPRRTETCKEFQYGELLKATNGFSPSNIIGQGGFGCVYKGTIAGDLVAVKQLKIGSEQGESEFLAEVNIISTVHHRHWVSLVGYCLSDLHMLLVYEYVPNGTMSEALHGQGKPCMNWVTRMKIALGTAQGLAYLHDGCRQNIIHRDIKSDNILLDDQWEAKVADFGLAKVKDHAQTHVSTLPRGTPGYVAPEYFMGGKLTDKADVYSFGVVLLELITGKMAIDTTLPDAAGQQNLVEWARPHLIQALKTQNVIPLADRNLMGEYDKKEMFAMVAVAAACVRHSSHKRPKMARALYALAPPDEDIYQGSIPGYSRVFAGGESSEDRLKKFNQVAFGSLMSEDSRGDEVSDAVETSTETEKRVREHSSAPSNQLTPPKPQNMKSQQTDQEKPYKQQNSQRLTCLHCCFNRLCSGFIGTSIAGYKRLLDVCTHCRHCCCNKLCSGFIRTSVAGYKGLLDVCAHCCLICSGSITTSVGGCKGLIDVCAPCCLFKCCSFQIRANIAGCREFLSLNSPDCYSDSPCEVIGTTVFCVLCGASCCLPFVVSTCIMGSCTKQDPHEWVHNFFHLCRCYFNKFRSSFMRINIAGYNCLIRWCSFQIKAYIAMCKGPCKEPFESDLHPCMWPIFTCLGVYAGAVFCLPFAVSTCIVGCCTKQEPHEWVHDCYQCPDRFGKCIEQICCDGCDDCVD